jgi:hypothetical protein
VQIVLSALRAPMFPKPYLKTCSIISKTSVIRANTGCVVRSGADKSLAFPIFLFAAQPKEFFLDVLNKLEQRSHKCV